MGQFFGEVDELALLVDIEGVFDADADLFFRDIDAGFDGEDGADLEWLAVVVGIVDIDADGVA